MVRVVYRGAVLVVLQHLPKWAVHTSDRDLGVCMPPPPPAPTPPSHAHAVLLLHCPLIASHSTALGLTHSLTEHGSPTGKAHLIIHTNPLVALGAPAPPDPLIEYDIPPCTPDRQEPPTAADGHPRPRGDRGALGGYAAPSGAT